jgi:hypothetical protein
MEIIEHTNNDSKTSKPSECILSENTEDNDILTTNVA